MKVYWIRHGEKGWTNVEGLRRQIPQDEPALDPPLVGNVSVKIPKGIRAISSPFRRCRDTAKSLGLYPSLDGRIGEFLGNVGHMKPTGFLFDEVTSMFDHDFFEDWQTLEKRVLDFEKDLTEDTIVITHGVVLQIIAKRHGIPGMFGCGECLVTATDETRS